jgi:predicted dehydrogenase
MTHQHAPLKAAIVGLRIHAGSLEPDKNHGLIKSFKAQTNVEVVAYCEWDPAERAALDALQAADPAARIYTDLADLLAAETFDLAVIMLPPSEATTAALRLAAAGKHLFIEKQAARTAAELRALCELVATNGLVTQVGYPWPYNPEAIEIKRHLDAGVLGRLVDMEARLVTLGVGPGLRDPQHWMYRAATEGGGILHMEGGHWLTLFRFFSQAEVKSVTALCSRVVGNIEEGLEDVATVALEFTNGVHACLHMGYLLSGAGPRNDMFIALRGTQGAVTWPNPGAGEFTIASASPTWQSAPVQNFHLQHAPRPVYADQWGYEFVAAFIRAILQGGQTPVSLEDGYRVLQIIDAAYESSQSGRRVVLY